MSDQAVTDRDRARLPRVFVGSSTEALKRGLTPAIVDAVRKGFPGLEVRPWARIFRNGRFALDTLIDEAFQADFAILIFARDDELLSRGRTAHITRGNVLLESGMFLARLGPRRVAHVVEEDVDVPSDLAGLVNITVPYSEGGECARSARAVLNELRAAWGEPQNTAAMGLDQTLRHMQDIAASYRERIVLRDLARPPALDPLVIDTAACTAAYKEALLRVQRRFWTTTYLTSEFWTTKGPDVLRANRAMLRRIRNADNRSVRRLFLLPKPESHFLQDQRFEIQTLKERDQTNEVTQRLRQVSDYRRYISRLIDDGCEVRVVHDYAGVRWRQLSAITDRRYREGDTEIAVYDKCRVDFFSGGSKGVIDRVQCFLPDMPSFDPVLEATRDYFKALWRDGRDALQFIKQWQKSLQNVASMITHNPEWRWRFDETDDELKAAEMRVVVETLNAEKSSRKRRYLDIGTCTARYPITLIGGGHIQPELTVAIDSDFWCCERSRTKLKAAGLSNVGVVWDDFLQWCDGANRPQFEAITCMLGTVSYFSASHGRHGVAKAIRAMSSLLAPNGVLFLGSWSDAARRNRDFLSIYSEQAKHQLVECTPASSDLMRSLNASSLQARVENVSDRIDLYVCRRVPQ